MINLFLPNKKTLFLIVGLGIFILVLALISLFSIPTTPPAPSINPSPFPSSKPLNNLPSSEPESTIPFHQIFQEGSVEKNYERIIGRKELSKNDQAIKSRLLQLTNGESGIIATTNLFIVEYLKSADYFMVQLTDPQIDPAKQGITEWFLKEGFSQEGICNLPVVLYLTTGIRDYLQQNNIKFDPIPEGCE